MSSPYMPSITCSICGETKAEYGVDWPGQKLCRECHEKSIRPLMIAQKKVTLPLRIIQDLQIIIVREGT